MKYRIFGPFRIDKNHKNGLIHHTNESKVQFWDRVKKKNILIPSARGCYLFAVRAGKGIKPWYVGQANKQSFLKEVFAPHKLNLYNSILAKRKGAPILFFICKMTRTNKFTKPGINKRKDIDYLESLMIGVVMKKNPQLLNLSKTKFLKKLVVPGLINTPQGKLSKSESIFKSAISV